MWEYAVMCVRITKMSDKEWQYEAIAWSNETEIYRRELTTMFWSAPLHDMGRDGWELVGTSSENAMMGSWVDGWSASTSRPVQTNFFFKRPARLFAAHRPPPVSAATAESVKR
jgi:hypothetical protein